MKAKLFLILILLSQINRFAQAQKYSPSQINTIRTQKTAFEGDLYTDSVNNIHYIGVSTGDLVSLDASSNWELTGNSTVPSNAFIGTSSDQKIQIRSNNFPLLEFGRRQTLGLVQNYNDYTDPNQPLVYLRGNNSTSALQFAASGASFYKPMFYTTTNGSFRLKGSAGVTDFFEMGSAGGNNQGRLEFIVGDDGDEPIIFKRYHYNNSGSIADDFYREFMRVQGSGTGTDAATRVGININTDRISLDPNYSHNYNGNIPAGSAPATSLRKANSTLEVNGSVAFSAIRTTTGTTTLEETDHTVIIGGNHAINLHSGSVLKGRMYIIKNPTNNTISITNYRNLSNVNANSIPPNSVLWLQHDGSFWQQINSSSSPSNGSNTINNVVKYAEYSFTGTINVNTSSNTYKDFFSTEMVNDGAVSRPGNNRIRINEGGLYMITFNTSLNRSSGSDLNATFLLYKNGSIISNASMEANSAYVSNEGGHTNSSVHFSRMMRLNTNDELRISTFREAGNGNLNAQGNRTSFTITKMRDL